MKLLDYAVNKAKEIKKKFLCSNEYNLKIIDIVQKKNAFFVVFQCANSNTLVRYPLNTALENEYILENICPVGIRLLSEINVKAMNKNNLALTEDGGYVFNNECEQYYSSDELVSLSKDEKFINSLDVNAGFLLGYLVGRDEVMVKDRPKVFLVKR